MAYRMQIASDLFAVALFAGNAQVGFIYNLPDGRAKITFHQDSPSNNTINLTGSEQTLSDDTGDSGLTATVTASDDALLGGSPWTEK